MRGGRERERMKRREDRSIDRKKKDSPQPNGSQRPHQLPIKFRLVQLVISSQPSHSENGKVVVVGHVVPLHNHNNHKNQKSVRSETRRAKGAGGEKGRSEEAKEERGEERREEGGTKNVQLQRIQHPKL